ncbi:hypothetical protein BX666DRAFT_1994904 [Dichotomocladium elegans]|nr:hypothetical protein BX666DRAFT_1994904 [Dichotomocladium elegans]
MLTVRFSFASLPYFLHAFTLYSYLSAPLRMTQNQCNVDLGWRGPFPPLHSPVPQQHQDDRRSPMSGALTPRTGFKVCDHGSLFSNYSSLSDRVSPLSFHSDHNVKTPTHGHSQWGLKEQEKVLDRLAKENLNFKFKMYDLQRRLQEQSSDHVHAALEENAKLKKSIQSLTLELKKYKKMILKMDFTIELLQKPNKQQQNPSVCTRHHGMSPQERSDYSEALSKAKHYESENERLREVIRGLSCENSQQRPARTRKGSSVWSITSAPLADRKNGDRISSPEPRQLIKNKDTAAPHLEGERYLNDYANMVGCGSNNSEHDSFTQARPATFTGSEPKNPTQEQEHNSAGRGGKAEMPGCKTDGMEQMLWNIQHALENQTNEYQTLSQKIEILQDQQQVATEDSSLLKVIADMHEDKKEMEVLVRKLDSELDHTKQWHQKEVEELKYELEKKENYLVDIEKQVYEMLVRAKEFESKEKGINNILRKLDTQKKMLSEKDQKIAYYKEQLAKMAERESELTSIVVVVDDEKLTMFENKMRRHRKHRAMKYDKC